MCQENEHENEAGNETEFGRNLISLIDDEGKEVSYEMIDALRLDDVDYVALLPAVEDPEEMLDEDYQVEIFRLEAEGDEEILVTIGSEEEFNRVWDAFEERLSDEYEIVN